MVPTRRLPSLSLAALALFSSWALAAEKKKPDTTVQEEAKVTVVEVPVNVIDKNGRPVENLTAADFEVYDDGQRQTISGFDVVDERRSVQVPGEGEPPIHPAARRHFMLVFDLSFNSPRGVVNAQRAARDPRAASSSAPRGRSES